MVFPDKGSAAGEGPHGPSLGLKTQTCHPILRRRWRERQCQRGSVLTPQVLTPEVLTPYVLTPYVPALLACAPVDGAGASYWPCGNYSAANTPFM